jgi:general secretion pathway protein K
MKTKQIEPRPDGFVLVVVLCMSICLSALLLGFNYKCRTNLRLADHLQKSRQALNYARAGLNIVIAAISDSNDIHADKTLLDLFSGRHSFIVGEGRCLITLTGESGKLNVNLLRDDSGTLDRTGIDRLLRLIDLLNQQDDGHPDIGYGLVAAIIDWTDSDDQVTCLPFVKQENLGAESGYYDNLAPSYRCRNGPLQTTEELLLVKGITPQIFDRIKGCVTVYGDGKINVNCASRLILQSVSEKMDAALTQLIIDRREFKPFGSVAELRDVPGMTDDIYQTIAKSATVDPADRYYQVVSRANVDSLDCTIVAVLERNMKTKTVEVVLYKEI